MRGVNKVIIVGHLGADPEARQFQNGGGVTSISVATSERWTDKQTGEMREATEWHRISLFNRLGEIAAQYLRKGSKVYIEGSLRTRKYQDQNGQDRYITEIRAEQMQMLDSAGGQNNNQGFNNQGGQNQGFNNQGFNNQGGQNQGFNNQGGQNQGFNNQGFNNQGGQNQGFNNQGGQNQGFNNQGGQNQGFNNQGGQNQGFNNQVSTSNGVMDQSVDDDIPF